MKFHHLITLVLSLALASSTATLAESPASIAINPFSQVITLQPGQTTQKAVFELVNNSSSARTFEVSDVDFGSLKDTGGLIFSGENATELQKKYGLTKWLAIEQPLITVAAGQTASVPVTILNRDDLTPGGHYGAVIFTEHNDSLTGQVSLHPAITSLLFVQKLGGEKYGLKLSSLQRNTNWWQSLALNLKFQNTGNIDVVPRGVVRLLNPQGHEVARSAINEDSTRILPETSRDYDITLTNTGTISTPGKYQLQVQYRYDGQTKFTTYTQNFYYLTFWTIALPVGALVILVALIILLLRLKRRRSPKKR